MDICYGISREESFEAVLYFEASKNQIYTKFKFIAKKNSNKNSVNLK